jgi:hypothetical protein
MLGPRHPVGPMFGVRGKQRVCRGGARGAQALGVGRVGGLFVRGQRVPRTLPQRVRRNALRRYHVDHVDRARLHLAARQLPRVQPTERAVLVALHGVGGARGICGRGGGQHSGGSAGVVDGHGQVRGGRGQGGIAQFPRV